jgi:hypothetical protein
MEVYNEATILAVGYHLVLFTDFLPYGSKQYDAGFSVIAITCLNILMNTILMVVMTIIELIQFIRMLRAYCKERKAKKYI